MIMIYLLSVPALPQLSCVTSDISWRSLFFWFFFCLNGSTQVPKKDFNKQKTRYISADVKSYITNLLLGVPMPDIYPSLCFSEAWVYILKCILNPKSYKKVFEIN